MPRLKASFQLGSKDAPLCQVAVIILTQTEMLDIAID